MTTEAKLDVYLRRINHAGSIAPTGETLAALLRLHPMAIPFETLDPVMGRPVRLQLTDLEQKLVLEKRGGSGVEHNLLLKAELDSMEFATTLLAATPPGSPETPFHVLVAVEISGVTWLADAGSADIGLGGPLRLRADSEQEQPGGVFRLTGGHPRWTLEVKRGEVFAPAYEFIMSPIARDDAVAIADANAAALGADLRVARLTETGRLVLTNNVLDSVAGSEVTTRTLSATIELREVLSSAFGLALPAGEAVDQALEAALRRGVRF